MLIHHLIFLALVIGSFCTVRERSGEGQRDWTKHLQCAVLADGLKDGMMFHIDVGCAA
jgi:hypothetical protein